jgi:uncharacterized membrane protein YebE (DUF533 family)
MKRVTLSLEACTETLVLLVIMAHADGRLLEEEKTGIRSAAQVLNLPQTFRGRLEAVLQEPLPIDQVLVESMSERDRSFAYVCCAWLSSVDDSVDPKELALLRQLETLFGLRREQARELALLAREVKSAHPATASRWAEQIIALFRAIPKHLESSEEVEVVFGETAV